MMGIHKITAGNGYTYLTDHTAKHDSTEATGKEMSDYYSEKGEKPGTWTGRGLASMGGIIPVHEGEEVTEEQMLALFGEGLHPNAEAIQARLIGDGSSPKKAIKATKLGRKFDTYEQDQRPFVVETAKRYQAWLKENGKSYKDEVPAEVRATIRTEVGIETFHAEHGRAPDERELNTHIARSTRPDKQAVAGYDLTFSPIKSASVLWALGDPQVAQAVSDAHDAAVAKTLEWVENEVAYTRLGAHGVRHVKTKGLIATAFVHRDSRAGEPDLHTHVAISNKVQADTNDDHDGQWVALDGQVMYKATVASSERYNTLLERELHERLGVEFVTRQTPDGRRPVREIAGIPPEWIERFSSRRAQIVQRAGQLQAEFRAQHGRPATPKESTKLFQQATLETREAKHEPRSEAEQRAQWNAAVYELEGGDIDKVNATLDAAIHRGNQRSTRLTDEQIRDLAGQVIETVSASRAMFQLDHLTAETLRRVRGLDLDVAAEEDTVSQVLAACTSADLSVRLDAKDTVNEPEALRRADGSSVYERARSEVFTTAQTLADERDVVAASDLPTTHTVPEDSVAVALLESSANGVTLNSAQSHLVTQMATSGKFVQLALAPAGSGKTTSMRALSSAWQTAHPHAEHGGGVLALAPTSVAAKELGASLNARSDTLAKLIWHLDHPHQEVPSWLREVGAGTMIVVDEAGMASTRDLARLVRFARSRDAVVRLVGDDQQLASVAAGGVLRDIAVTSGAVTLSELVRFRDPAEASATLSLRDGDTKALGFYLDHDRARVTAEGDLESDVYAAWQQAHDEGHSALMLAYSTDTVNALNARARADKIDAGLVDTSIETDVSGGLRAGAGDVIVTRANDRRLPLSLTDFVKNGDRWRVTHVHEDGSLHAQHEQLGTSVHLPADYVASSVDLGYASTIHGAQGQTVHSSFALIRGEETRQLLYVAMSRGTDMNRVFVPVGGEGDPHEAIREATTNPRVVTEILEGVLARDGAQVSATTTRREQHDPRTLLKRDAERYADAVAWAATRALPEQRRTQIRDLAEARVPGITEAASWQTLASNLAMIDLNGGDALAAFTDAVEERDLGSARDLAAVIDWRLDPTGEHSSGSGPLPWTPAIPAALKDGPYADWLSQRADTASAGREAMRDIVTNWTEETVPEWARDIYTRRPELTASLLAWRAAHDVPDDESSPAGPAHPVARERRVQRSLEERYDQATGGHAVHGRAFIDQLQREAPEVLSDVWWPVLAQRLDLALGARLPVHEHLSEAIKTSPLPVDYAAAALWYRLTDVLEPAIATTETSGPGMMRLRPAWSTHLSDQLGREVALRVMTDPHWPSLVAAVHHAAAHTSLTPEDVLTRGLDLIGRDMLPTTSSSANSSADDDTQPRLEAGALATILALRVSDLTAEAPPDDLVGEDDVLDPDIEDFLAHLAAEKDDDRPREERDPTALPQASDDAPVIDPDDADAPPEDDELPPDPQQVEDAGDEPVEDGTPAQRLRELTQAAADYYTSAYDGSASQEYMRGRFGTDLSETPYVVGHAGAQRDALTTHLQNQYGATADELLDAGLSKWRYGRLEDVFRNRVILGMHDSHGDLVGFTGRDLSGNHPAKYLNTPTTKIFRKGALLDGLHPGRVMAESTGLTTRPDLVGVEGPMDAIAVTLAGGGRVVGVAAGTGGFSTDQADQLAAYTARTEAGTIWLAKDNDRAGRAALAKDMTAFAQRGITARALPQPGGKDFAEAYQNDPGSVSTILDLREHAPLAARFVLMDMATRLDLENADIPTRVAGIRQAGDIIAQLPPQHWEVEIDQAATLFTTDENDQEAYDHYATRLYETVLVQALHWDPETHAPAPDSSDLEAAGDLSRLHDLLTTHNQPVVTASERMNNAIAKLRENLTQRQTSQTASQRPRTPRRDTTRERDPHRYDGPSQDGPSL